MHFAVCATVQLSVLISGYYPQQLETTKYEFAQRQMGVTFRISLYAGNEPAANKAAEAAFARIAELNAIMSDYDQTSEVSRLCQTSQLGKPVQVSADLFRVLCRSQQLACRSNGAFDVTVGPLSKLWRRARRRGELPPPDMLSAARQTVGYCSVILFPQMQTVELQKQKMRLDLGGIAKGDAADQARLVLRQHGITSVMIDAGGDIVVGDAPPGRAGWRIGIAPLEAADGPPSQYISLRNAAVATSGDAFQFVEIDNVRYSHLINPKTGVGLTERSSVTIVAPDGITADSLASAVSVLGVKPGLKLIANTPGTAAVFVVIQDGHPRAFSSPLIKQYVIDTKP